jgi:hypothetical protein
LKITLICLPAPCAATPDALAAQKRLRAKWILHGRHPEKRVLNPAAELGL